MLNIAIIGSSGAIGSAFVKKLHNSFPHAQINLFAGKNENKSENNIHSHHISYTDEASIAEAAQKAAINGLLDLVIVATGVLHDDLVSPEKSMREITLEKLQHVFTANTFFPALIAKHFLPKLAKDRRAIFAALSARVGSISDNQLGGWYSYRASKAALNMLIKNLAIEMKMRCKQAIVVGLHPGTVDSKLSNPFKANVPAKKLFTPDYAVERLLLTLDGLDIDDSGKCFAWDGGEILP